MAINNRTTDASIRSDFFNRVAPYDGNPLIQKTEHNEILNNLADSVVFKTPLVGTINAPGATFNADFVSNDEIAVDTSSSVPSAFVITIQNLLGNSVGKLSITKKSGDTFTFSNADIVPSNTNSGQTGKTEIAFMIIVVDGTFKAVPLFTDDDFAVVGTAVSTGDTIDVSECFVRRTQRGTVEFKGSIVVSVSGGSTTTNLCTIPSNLRPSRTSGFIMLSLPYEEDGTLLQAVTGVYLNCATGVVSTISVGTGIYYFDGITYTI